MATYNIHGGHCPDGKGASGAVGLIKESTNDRKVKNLVKAYLEGAGNKVYDCTCDTSETQSGCLKKILAKCNAHKVDLDISIHFNSGAKDKTGNGKTTGTEVLIKNSNAKAPAERILKRICALGFKNRGIKTRTDLYFLNVAKSPALLIECCFVDDKDDVALYTVASMGKAIAEGIMNKSITTLQIVSEDGLNMRKSASANGELIKTLANGKKVGLIKKSGDWAYTYYAGDYGWINTKYTKVGQ